MAERDFQWFLQHADAYNALSVEQLHELGQGGTIDWEGEVAAVSVDTPPADASAPVAATEPTAPSTPAATAQTDAALEAANARVKELETLTAQQSELLSKIQTAKATDAVDGGTQAQEDVLADFAKDFPEIAEKLRPALEKIIDAGVTAKTSELQRQLEAAIQPLQQNAIDTQVDAHFQTITEAIPDFETIRDSGEVEKWLQTQPSYVRAAADRVLTEGTASEVIELFTQYKSSLGKPTTPPALTKEEIEKKAAEAVAKAKGKQPLSSTDIPASSTQVVDEEPTTAIGWSQKFAKMSPEQILKSL